MQYDLSTLGKRIQKIRKEMKISQTQLAERIYRERGFISNIERGNSEPTLSDLFRMCECFNCELGYLLGEPEYEHKTKEMTTCCNVTGLSEVAVQRLNSALVIYNESLSTETQHNFINYFISTELIPLALEIELLALENDPVSKSLYFRLPSKIRSVIEDHAHLNASEGGCLDDYNFFIFDVYRLIANDEEGKQIIEQCRELAKTKNYEAVSSLISKTTQNQINMERVARIHDSYGDTSINTEDLFIVCRVAFVCCYSYTLSKVKEPVERFEISEKFNQIVNDYIRLKNKRE